MAISYLHYYYGNSNSPFTSAEFFENKRKNLLDMQLKVFEQQKKAILNKVHSSRVPKEYAEMLEILTDTGNAGQLRNQIYAGANPSGGIPDKVLFDTALGGISSAGSIQNTSVANIAAKVGDIVENIDNFQTGLENTLDKAYQTLFGNGNFEAYKQAVIADYIANQGLSGQDSSIIKQHILDNFLHHEGFIKSGAFAKNTTNRVEDSLKKLILFADALPAYNDYLSGAATYSTKKYSGTINGLPEFFKIIAGKTQGLYNMVKGDGAELTTMLGEKAVIKKIGKPLANLDKVFTVTNTGSNSTGGVSVISTYKKDANWDKAFGFDNLGKQYDGSVSKPDVTVTYNLNGVKINYGLTVKNYEMQNANNGTDKYFIDAKLTSETTLYDAMSRIFSGTGMYGVYQLAGGHGNGNVKLVNGNRYTNGQLDEMWNSLKDMVIAGNILTFLGGLKEDNTLFMVANGRVIGLDQILRDIINGKTKESYSIKGASARSRYMSENKWEDSEKDNHANALKRSAAAGKSIESLLRGAKITTHLKIFFS